jgi:hypothetical protein
VDFQKMPSLTPWSNSPFMGQRVPQPSDFEAEMARYKELIEKLPEAAAAPIRETMKACELYMTPEYFAPPRIRGCLSSVFVQIQAAAKI